MNTQLHPQMCLILILFHDLGAFAAILRWTLASKGFELLGEVRVIGEPTFVAYFQNADSLLDQ